MESEDSLETEPRILPWWKGCNIKTEGQFFELDLSINGKFIICYIQL